jgi:molybdopterin-guanine dinucleotide biosynthesis protein A
MKSRMLKNTGSFGRNRLNVSGYILVGGASSRFGTDKALVEIGGKPLAMRVHALLRKACVPEIWLVGDPAKYGRLGVKCLADARPGEGPLGGILTSLRNTAQNSTSDYNLIIGCDMPFLTEDWMEELLSRAFESDADVVVARSASGLEPLCAVWRTEVTKLVEAQFEKGVRKITEVMNQLQMEMLDESVWKRFDKNDRLFWNMNTPADFVEVRRILEERDQWEEKFGRREKKFKKPD